MQGKDYIKALNYSFLLLRYRARSKSEIRSRLKKKGCSSDVMFQVLDHLENNNYINDKDFVSFFTVSSLEKGWGPRRIDAVLRKLGISSELRKQARVNKDIYKGRIREIIEKKLLHYRNNKPDMSSEKIWQKIFRHLTVKGFDYDDIFREMDNLGLERIGNT